MAITVWVRSQKHEVDGEAHEGRVCTPGAGEQQARAGPGRAFRPIRPNSLAHGCAGALGAVARTVPA